MVAFVRASNAGCRTPFKELQDATGHISKEILCRDPEFKTMIEEGWEFIVLPWQVGATWPQLAEFAQRALNASKLRGHGRHGVGGGHHNGGSVRGHGEA